MCGWVSGSVDLSHNRPRLRGCVDAVSMVKFGSGGLVRPWSTNAVGPPINCTFGTSRPAVDTKPPTSPPLEAKGPPWPSCQSAMFSGLAISSRSVEC